MTSGKMEMEQNCLSSTTQPSTARVASFALRLLLLGCAVVMASLIKLPWLAMLGLGLLGASLLTPGMVPEKKRVQVEPWAAVTAWMISLAAPCGLLLAKRDALVLDLYYAVLAWLLAAALALAGKAAGALPAKSGWRRLGMGWAFLGGVVWMATAYLQNELGAFIWGLLINLGLLIAGKRWFRLPAVAILAVNTLVLMIILLPLADLAARRLESKGVNLTPAGRPYSYEAARKNPHVFRRWWGVYCGQINQLIKDVSLPDPEHLLRYRIRPNSQGSFFQSRIHINSRGFRGKEIAANKGDTYRIVALGESTTFGFTLTPEHRPWPELLEEMIQQRLKPGRPVEVINAGLPMYSLEDNLRRLPEDILPLNPDMIISYHGFNGFELLSEALPPIGKHPPAYKRRPLQLFAECEFRLKMIFYRRSLASQPVPPPVTVTSLMKTRYALAYQRLAEIAQTNRIRLVLANYSMAVNGGSDPDVVEFYREGFPPVYSLIKANEMHSTIVETTARQHPGVGFLDTHPQLDGAHDKFVDIMHFTPEGDRQLAEALFNGLQGILQRDVGGP